MKKEVSFYGAFDSDFICIDFWMYGIQHTTVAFGMEEKSYIISWLMG